MKYNKTKIELDSEDSKQFLECLQSIYLLQKQIDTMQYTGIYNAQTQENCEHILNSLRNLVMGKIIEIE